MLSLNKSDVVRPENRFDKSHPEISSPKNLSDSDKGS
jgi:hypothetical protein